VKDDAEAQVAPPAKTVTAHHKEKEEKAVHLTVTGHQCHHLPVTVTAHHKEKEEKAAHLTVTAHHKEKEKKRQLT
jgi:hypothetical protein